MNLLDLAKQRYSSNGSMASKLNGITKDIRKKWVRQSFSLPTENKHKLEFIANIEGVDYINDSESTKVNCLWYALEEMARPVILIAGGMDKGNDYKKLGKELIEKKVKTLITLGTDCKKMQQFFGDYVEAIYCAKTMKQAVDGAYNIAKKGDIVLLSPACASFDLFENYEDRGDQFKECVNAL